MSSLILLLLLSGCAAIVGTLPAPSERTGSGALRVGAARTDITPPPGFPMGGFASAGKISHGYWMRLHARAIYIEDADGRALVLVACDLWSIAAGLADRVASLVAEHAETAHLGRDQILLAASHTHHSPGNFSSSPALNFLASPKVGFDRRLFDFLAQSIAVAIRDASASARSARMYVGETRVHGLARNRSFPAFRKNPEAAAILRENLDLPVGKVWPLYPHPEAYRAVDPRVTVIRFDDLEGQPIAVAAFAASHPNTMGPKTEIYTSELFGVAALHAERELPLVALFNGAEGDISGAWEEQDSRNTVRLGQSLGNAILDANRDARATGDVVLGHRFEVIRLDSRRFELDGTMRRTAGQPLPGAPLLGGAEDGRTEAYFENERFREGVTGSACGHGVKKRPYPFPVPIRLAIWLLQPPRRAPLGIYRIGPVALAALPGECTTVLGRRIRTKVATALDARTKRVLVVGLANEYLSYFATPEEYALQHYEGASMLYGEHAGSLLAFELERMARDVEKQEYSLPRRYNYSVGFRGSFGMRLLKDPPWLADVLLDWEGNWRPEQLPIAEWSDVVPRLPAPRLTPRVFVERRKSGVWTVVDDDAGMRIVVAVVGVESDRSKWRAHWIPPAALRGPGEFRFRVERVDGTMVRLEPFSLPGGS